MEPRTTIAVGAIFGATLLCAREVRGQTVAEVPAIYRGTTNCASLYPGSFLDVGTAACWQCPSTHPNRTIFPVTSGQACERPATELFRRAAGPERPTGLIGTDCRSGWFLDIGKRACYSCSGYNRTAYPIDHARACSRAVPLAWTSAARRGAATCPAGSFRHGLTDRCYACPDGYFRNAVIADDLTKVNACSRISTTAREETRAKFELHKNEHAESRQNLGLVSQRMNAVNFAIAEIDRLAPAVMKEALDNELGRLTGFDVISMLISGGGASGAGYTHAMGYVMTKENGAYRCRKAWSNAFTFGITMGIGVVMETSLSKGGASEGLSESNGWQAAAAFPPVSGGMGFHWDASTDEFSLAFTFGPAFAVDLNYSEYVHTWSGTGKEVSCDALTWGPGWFNL
jgi:hypothetical protein